MKLSKNIKISGGLMVVIIAMLLTILTGCGSENGASEEFNAYKEFVTDIELENEGDKIAVVDTVKGMFAFEVYTEKVPVTADNFINLVNQKFYDGLTFHLVRPGFVIQTGDPTGVGTGDSGTEPIKLEINPDLSHSEKGIVGMARKEDDIDSATSQFYITLDGYPELDRKFAVFGKVKKGLDVVESIQKQDKINRIVILP